MTGLGRVKLGVGVALLAAVALFAIQNAETVEVTWLFWSLEMPRSILIVLLLLAGAIVGWILKAALGRRSRRAEPD